ncbi:MAG: phosphoenolpyruvate synthase [Microgenomates bacterium OLB22]|nr:MAG: phosphoenolpyruvate synthase [Microgenomates bacterium OLB22]
MDVIYHDTTELPSGKKNEVPDLRSPILARGKAMLPGVVVGAVCLAGRGDDAKPGSIIVSRNCLSLPHNFLKRASGLILEEDSPTVSHFIASLPHAIPVIVGASHATSLLSKVHTIRMDGISGVVYRVEPQTSTKTYEQAHTSSIKNAVSVYQWVESTRDLRRVKASSVDGIVLDGQALVRELEVEHISIMQKKSTYSAYIEKIVHKSASDVFPKPLIFVASPTSGISIFTTVADDAKAHIWDIELEALRRVQAAGMTNVEIAPPESELVRSSSIYNQWLVVNTPATAHTLAYSDDFSYKGAIISIDEIYLLIRGLTDFAHNGTLPSYDKTTEAFIQGVLRHAQDRSISTILLSKHIPLSEALLADAVTYQTKAVALPMTSRF